MGNYKFKLSDMMPNAWFYKLRDNMGGRTTRNQTSSSTRKKKQPSSQQNSTTTTTQSSSKPKCNPRKSYYFTRELNHTSPADNNLNISETNFPQQPRKSSKQKPKKKTPNASISSSFSPVYSSEEESEFLDPEIRTDRVLLQTVKFDEKISTCRGCNNLQNNNNDIIINVDNNSLAKKDDVFDSFSKLMMLPPIVTKPEKFNDFLNDPKKKENKKGSLKVKIVNSEQRKTNNNSRRFSVNSPGVKLKINSPRIGSRKVQLQLHGRKSVTGTGTGGYRRSISDSLAIVKSSVNPGRDFRESMVEMIVQNNIRSSKDLEDLLACYLSLNSDEYHEVIIKVFKQIWFDLTDNQ